MAEHLKVRRLGLLVIVLTLSVDLVGCARMSRGHSPLGTDAGRVASRYQGMPLRVLSQPDPPALVTHTVKAGETIWGIAQVYGLLPGAIARLNGIDDPKKLSVGQVLSIHAPAGVSGGPPPQAAKKAQGAAKPNRKGKQAAMAWPVKGVVTTRFGRKHGKPHDGVDIAAARGVKVVAASDGEVIFSSKHGGYGNLVVIRHIDGLVTVYAHNESNLVTKGDKVRRGQAIAKVGDTGKAAGPHLHFEVRRGATPQNPLKFLTP